MNIIETERVFEIEESYSGDRKQRKARIVFDIKYSKLKFARCNFEGVGLGAYTLEDWMFLKEIAEAIKAREGMAVSNSL